MITDLHKENQEHNEESCYKNEKWHGEINELHNKLKSKLESSIEKDGMVNELRNQLKS